MDRPQTRDERHLAREPPVEVEAGCGSCAFCLAVSCRVIADLYFAGASASTRSKAGGPQIGAGTKALGNRGTRPPGACSLALTDRLCGPFVEVFLKQIETLPQSIG